MDLDNLHEIMQKEEYLFNRKAVLNKVGIFSGYSEDYIQPLEPSAYG